MKSLRLSTRITIWSAAVVTVAILLCGTIGTLANLLNRCQGQLVASAADALERAAVLHTLRPARAEAVARAGRVAPRAGARRRDALGLGRVLLAAAEAVALAGRAAEGGALVEAHGARIDRA